MALQNKLMKFIFFVPDREAIKILVFMSDKFLRKDNGNFIGKSYYIYFIFIIISQIIISAVPNFYIVYKTSMMCPSQNFLLYNGTIIKIKVNEWINN